MGLVNHWAPERHPGWATRQSAFILGLVVDDDAVLAKVAEVQRALGHSYLDRVAATDLYVLVADLGSAEAGSHEQAVALAKEAAATRSEPFNVDFGVAAVFGESVLSFVDPVEEIAAMQERATAVIDRFNQLSLVIPTFPPHVTLAWVNRDGPSFDLAATLAEYPVDGLGSTTVTELCLLRVTRESRRYNYEVVERLPLSGKGSKGSRNDESGKKPIWKRLFK